MIIFVRDGDSSSLSFETDLTVSLSNSLDDSEIFYTFISGITNASVLFVFIATEFLLRLF